MKLSAMLCRVTHDGWDTMKSSDKMWSWQNVVFMLKILEARFQQYANWERPDVQAGSKKVEEPDIKPEIQIFIGS